MWSRVQGNVAGAHLLLEICSQLRSASSARVWSFWVLAAMSAWRLESSSSTDSASSRAAKPLRNASIRSSACPGPKVAVQSKQHRQLPSHTAAPEDI